MKNGSKSNWRTWQPQPTLHTSAPVPAFAHCVGTHLEKPVVRNLRKVHKPVRELVRSRHPHAATLANTIREIGRCLDAEHEDRYECDLQSMCHATTARTGRT